MKLIFIVTDVAATVHAGGGVERRAYELEVPDSTLPKGVLKFLEDQVSAARDGRSLYAQLEIVQKP